MPYVLRRCIVFRITGIRSWNLNADDLEAMVSFYKELGAEEASRQTIGGAAVARLRAGSQGIGLFDGAEGPRPGVPHHTFSCEGPADPEELTRELEERGIKVDAVRRQGESANYSVYVFDPSGNRLELAVAPAASS
jgi:catechol 2,3-dioxygenase-like lactoylglutathione lyase family enzyme